MKRVLIIGLIVLLLLQCTGIVSGAEPVDYSKIVIMHLTINGSSITEKSVEMRYGHAPNLELRSGDFKGTLKSADGSTIREFDLWDPRYQLGDVLEKDNESSVYLSGDLSYSDNADLILILPYYENQVTFELNDKKTGALLKKVNMSPAIMKFQSDYPKDPGIDTGSPIQIDMPDIYLIIGIVISILIIGMMLSMIRKK
jgi:hypothetical protein